MIGIDLKIYRKEEGFTLIELMIVIIIIGVLATIAIPRYFEAARKAKESEAPIMLKQVHNLMHAYFHEHDTYLGATLANIGFAQQSLVTAGGPAKYTIALGALTATTYTATATAVVDFDNDAVMNVWAISDNGTAVILAETTPD